MILRLSTADENLLLERHFWAQHVESEPLTARSSIMARFNFKTRPSFREIILTRALESIRDRIAPRWILCAVACLTCMLFVGAPVLAAKRRAAEAGMIYMIFAPVCHQISARSFHLLGHPLAVCQRCSGIYFGIFAASILFPALPGFAFDETRRRYWVLGASAPLLLDFALSYSGIWNSTSLVRTSSGFLFGAMITSLMVPALSEWMLETAWCLPHHQSSDTEGGMS